MYFIKIKNLGFIHQDWQQGELRFSPDKETAKAWVDTETAIKFGSEELTAKHKMGWQLLEEDEEGELVILIQPKTGDG